MACGLDDGLQTGLGFYRLNFLLLDDSLLHITQLVGSMDQFEQLQTYKTMYHPLKRFS